MNSQIFNNSAIAGAGIKSDGFEPSLVNSNISNNNSTDYGSDIDSIP